MKIFQLLNRSKSRKNSIFTGVCGVNAHQESCPNVFLITTLCSQLYLLSNVQIMSERILTSPIFTIAVSQKIGLYCTKNSRACNLATNSTELILISRKFWIKKHCLKMVSCSHRFFLFLLAVYLIWSVSMHKTYLIRLWCSFLLGKRHKRCCIETLCSQLYLLEMALCMPVRKSCENFE